MARQQKLPNWASVFAGMGLAFFLAHSLVSRLPDYGLAAASIVCFVVSILMRRMWQKPATPS
jgi:hypothetical protein